MNTTTKKQPRQTREYVAGLKDGKAGKKLNALPDGWDAELYAAGVARGMAQREAKENPVTELAGMSAVRASYARLKQAEARLATAEAANAQAYADLVAAVMRLGDVGDLYSLDMVKLAKLIGEA